MYLLICTISFSRHLFLQFLFAKLRTLFQDLIFDSSRTIAFQNCGIQTAFAVPIFSSANSSPTCILCCYSLLPAESVPFVLNFVQKAVRLLWDGLDKIVNPHESVGKELWRDVAPADLGEMAADLEMQKAFMGKKRPRSKSMLELNKQDDDRDRKFHSEDQHYVTEPLDSPPLQGLSPAPLFPTTVQEVSQNAQQFVYLDGDSNGHWAVQQAVRSVGHMNFNNGTSETTFGFANGSIPQYQNQPSAQEYQMTFVDYSAQNGTSETVDNHQSRPAEPLPVNTMNNVYPQQAHVDDPETIRATLLEINAMAQSHLPTLANGNGGIRHQVEPMQYANLDQMNFAPFAQATGPAVLNGAQQNMFCSTTAHPVSITSMNLSSNMNKKICRIQGCDDPAVAKRPYCARHCGNRQCERDGCTKCAQGATRFCIAHGGGRRCTFPGCDKGARDKFFCAA